MLRRLVVLMLVMIAACTTDPRQAGQPRLVLESTLRPTDVLPGLMLSPSPIVIPVATVERSTPLAMVTVAGSNPDFVLLTPTLPPSKTSTPTATQTPTDTLTPTITDTPQFLPQVVLSPPNVSSAQQPCAITWFFAKSLTSSCPLGSALVSTASFQQFQQGFMIWVGQQDAIYVVYDSARQPRWEVFRDNYEDSMPEYDPALGLQNPPYTWQPRRGFGLLWRSNEAMKERLGWAVREWEEPYTTQLQIATDGTIFLVDPRDGIIGLQAGGRDWDRYLNS
jgi:hypothetical protein